MRNARNLWPIVISIPSRFSPPFNSGVTQCCREVKKWTLFLWRKNALRHIISLPIFPLLLLWGRLPPYQRSANRKILRATYLWFVIIFSVVFCSVKNTVKLHKSGPLLHTASPVLPFCLLPSAQVGAALRLSKVWATKTIIFEDVRGHKMTSFFTCKFSGQFAVQGIFFSPPLLVKNSRNSPRKIGATK